MEFADLEIYSVLDHNFDPYDKLIDLEYQIVEQRSMIRVLEQQQQQQRQILVKLAAHLKDISDLLTESNSILSTFEQRIHRLEHE